MSSEPQPPHIPQVTDKRQKVAGLLPKNAQGLVLGGVALLMILVILFSGHNAPVAKSVPRIPATAGVLEPSQDRIRDYHALIGEQMRKLAAEEAAIAQTKQTLSAGSEAGAPVASARSYTAYAPGERVEPQRTWIETDRQKREYQSLFASNIALSYRSATAKDDRAAQVQEVATQPGEVLGHRGGAEGLPAATSAETGMYRLFEGTVLETVLTNRLDGSFSGPIDCMVTTDLYSFDGAKLLVPQGTRVLGEVKKLDSFGQQRLAVSFHRMIMPDGYSVSLDQFQGLDQIGETGLVDQVNHHYLQVFGVSIAIGAIAGLAQVNTGYGLNESAAAAYEQGAAASLSQSSLHILDRYLNVLPTFTIREGFRVKVYLSQDLALPAYDQHPVREDL